jgi:hypothetical protein
MKYLSDYTEEEITKAMRKAGAFWAFSDKQFNEQKREGVEYSHISCGLICPKGKGKELIEDLDRAIGNGRKQDIEENGIEKIIRRELANHEATYTGDITSTEQALKGYNIPKEDIIKVYKIMLKEE